MHGIYIMAVITTLIALVAYGTTLWFITKPEDRRAVLIAGAITLPLCALVFYVIRVPILNLTNTLIDPETQLPLLVFVQLLYAPLTEEPAKLVPLIIPAIRKRITPQNFVSFALAMGLGFGIGEAWMLAYQVATAPQYAGMAFYLFTGFLTERLMVMIMHGFFTGAALRGITRGRAALGIATAMLLHWLGNAPIALIILNVGGLGREVWQVVVSMYISLMFGIGLLALMMWRRRLPGRADSHARCPECNTVYERPAFAINLLTHRYERCPACHHWHWINPGQDPDVEPFVPKAV